MSRNYKIRCVKDFRYKGISFILLREDPQDPDHYYIVKEMVEEKVQRFMTVPFDLPKYFEIDNEHAVELAEDLRSLGIEPQVGYSKNEYINHLQKEIDKKDEELKRRDEILDYLIKIIQKELNVKDETINNMFQILKKE